MPKDFPARPSDARDVDGGFIRFLYGRAFTRGLTGLLLRRASLRMVGFLADSRLSRPFIAPFAKKRGIEPRGDYNSFNAFFARTRADARFARGDAFASPCEGNLRVIDRLPDDASLTVKGEAFSLDRLFDADASAWAGGCAYLYALTTAHCHRLYCPDDAVLESVRDIPGRYHATHPAARAAIPGVMHSNHRVACVLDTRHFGRVALVLVGSMLVGSATLSARPGESVKRGDTLGFFRLGGSAAVLLFARNAIVPCERLAGGEGAYVDVGERIGTTGGAAKTP